MTKDEVIALAQEAGKHQWPLEPDFLERFAALVAAHEREACARICEGNGDGLGDEPVALRCADAIRSRT